MKKKSILIISGSIFVALFTFFIIIIYAFFPIKYSDCIKDCAQKYSIDTKLLRAVIWTESRYDKNAVSKAGASGLMQLMPETAEWCAEKLNKEYCADLLFNPNYNIELGTFYLSYLINKYGETDALVCYNAGEGNYLKWQGEIKFKETRQYIKKVRFSKFTYKIITMD